MKQSNFSLPCNTTINIYININPSLIQSENAFILPKIFTEFKKHQVTEFQLFFAENLTTDPEFSKLFDQSDFKKIKFICELPTPQIHFCLTFGGDGAFLWAYKTLKNQKEVVYFCTNTGNLGFLTSFVVSDFERLIEGISAHMKPGLQSPTLMITQFSRLQGRIFDKAGNVIKVLYAINEIVATRIKNYCPRFQVFWNKSPIAKMGSDGLIVSSTLGSTAYNSAVGGPILLPSSDNFVLSAIAPFGINFRPIVFSRNDILGLKIHDKSGEKECLVVSDSNEEVIMEEGQLLEITIDKEGSVQLASFGGVFEEVWLRKLQSVFKWD